ncbi:MAG: glutaredoxin family protein [Desulfobacteraceae bacterium]|nr:glutaredoxin family protein [Desulfobacteraceae bacterium]
MLSKNKLITISFAFMFVVVFLLCCQAVSAKMYVWTDENGVKHFSDSPAFQEEARPDFKELPTVISKPSEKKDPDKEGEDSRKKSQKDQDKDAAQKDAAGEQEDDTVVKRNYQPREIELYVTSWCKYCKKAKAFLDARRIDYQVYDVEKDTAAAARMKKMTSSKGVPFAVINGEMINGWNKQLYENALKK